MLVNKRVEVPAPYTESGQREFRHPEFVEGERSGLRDSCE